MPSSTDALREFLAPLVMSDGYLDTEEEFLFFEKAGELGVSREMAETNLRDVLQQYDAVRESELQLRISAFLQGAALNNEISEEQQQEAYAILMQLSNNITLQYATEIVEKACESLHLTVNHDLF